MKYIMSFVSNFDKIVSFLYFWYSCKRKDNEKNIYRITLFNAIIKCTYDYAAFTFEQFWSGKIEEKMRPKIVELHMQLLLLSACRVVLRPTG